MKSIISIVAACVCASLRAATLEEQIANRAAIERVYYSHRIGVTEPFEQVLPAADLRRLVERERAREQVLRQHYDVEITSYQVAAEVRRIEQTTRAPETLAEVKAALGNDPSRFAEAFAKPMVVERELRSRFQNDDALHAGLRHECESVRTNLLASRAEGSSSVELGARLKQIHSHGVSAMSWRLLDGRVSGNEQSDRAPAFTALPSQLRRVLAAQLRTAGDVSAVIEMPDKFLLFVAIEKTEEKLEVACMMIPKPDCDTWLASQFLAGS